MCWYLILHLERYLIMCIVLIRSSGTLNAQKSLTRIYLKVKHTISCLSNCEWGSSTCPKIWVNSVGRWNELHFLKHFFPLESYWTRCCQTCFLSAYKKRSRMKETLFFKRYGWLRFLIFISRDASSVYWSTWSLSTNFKLR